jgi:fluoride exporter
VHLRPRSIALVAAGGALGTATRYLVSQVVPHVRGVPVGVLLINVVGAFLLGLLLARLLGGPDTGPRLDLRLLLGTGFLGGFTTYSALATDTVALLVGGDAGRALAYALGTLVLGLLASLLGLWCGGRTSASGAPS